MLERLVFLYEESGQPLEASDVHRQLDALRPEPVDVPEPRARSVEQPASKSRLRHKKKKK